MIHQDAKNCKYCGYSHPFGRRFCPAAEQECHGCGRRGHFKTVCISSGKPQQKFRARAVHSAAVEDYSSDSEDCAEMNVGYLTAFKSSKKIYSCRSNKPGDVVKLQFPDYKTEFSVLVDTGADVSVLPRRIFDKMQPNPVMKKTKVVLVSFTGSRVYPIGKIWIEGIYDDKK